MEITLFGQKFFVNRAVLIAATILLAVGSGALGYFLRQVYQPLSSQTAEDNIIQVTEPDSRYVSEEIQQEEEIPDIKVYVTGCVHKPGVVTIKKGQVIDDAIKEAGGATEAADLENINLAYKLNENSMLRIKSKASVLKDSEKSVNADAGIKPGKSPAQKNDGINSGADIITDSLGTVVGQTEAKEEGGKGSNLVNINRASQAELEDLPNIGPATAKAIIEYREKNGEFKKVTDIMKITGIKQKTYDKIKENITVE